MNSIHLICLGVRDMKQSLAFYKNIGFETFEKEDAPPVVFFNNRGTKLELFPLEDLAQDICAESPPKLSAGGFGGITLACNMKSKQEVDDCFALVARHGGFIVKQPQKTSWGGYSGYFQDPNGYYWEIAWGEMWKFDDSDMLQIEKPE